MSGGETREDLIAGSLTPGRQRASIPKRVTQVPDKAFRFMSGKPGAKVGGSVQVCSEC